MRVSPYLNKKKYSDAIVLLKRYLSAKSSPNISNLLHLAYLYDAGKSSQEVMDIFRVNFYTLDKSVSLFDSGRLSDAEAVLIKAVAKDPFFAEGYYNLGMINNKLNKSDKALFFINKSKKLDPSLR